MLTPYIPVFIILSLTAGFGCLILGLTFIIGPRNDTPVKSQVYESGLVPIGPGRRRTSVRFYLTATLFILFDIEVIYLYPWAVSFRGMARPAPEGIGHDVVWTMFSFLGVLALGFIYIWRKGALEWGIPDWTSGTPGGRLGPGARASGAPAPADVSRQEGEHRG